MPRLFGLASRIRQFLRREAASRPGIRPTGAARRLLRDSVAVFAHAVLISLIPLLPVSAAFDLEDPHPPQPPVEQARTSAVYITAGFGAPLGLLGIEGV